MNRRSSSHAWFENESGRDFWECTCRQKLIAYGWTFYQLKKKTISCHFILFYFLHFTIMFCKPQIRPCSPASELTSDTAQHFSPFHSNDLFSRRVHEPVQDSGWSSKMQLLPLGSVSFFVSSTSARLQHLSCYQCWC